MEEPKLLRDHWTRLDQLGFADYREALVRVIRTAETPITIAIYGTWGSGKTSLMRMVEEALRPDHCCVWFDAWKYDKERILWRAFLQHVLNNLRPLAQKGPETDKILTELENSLYREVVREELGRLTVDPARLAKGVLKLGLPLVSLGGIGAVIKGLSDKGADAVDDLVDAFHRKRAEIHIDRVRFLDEFLKKFETVVKYVTGENRRLVVFVDDLDRCLPERSIQILEAIKLFMDVEETVFLVGVDPKVIERGIEVRYRESRRPRAADEGPSPGEQADLPISGERYIEKIVQLPFALPPIDRDQVRQFIQDLRLDLPGRCPEVFTLGLEANPRRIKRAINTFTLLRLLAERRGELRREVKWELLAKLVIIQAGHRDLCEALPAYPSLLYQLEAHFLGEQEREANPPRAEQVEELQRARRESPEQKPAPLAGTVPPAKEEETILARYINRRSLRDLLLCGEERFTKLGATPLEATERLRRVYLSLAQTVGEPARAEAAAILDERLWGDLLSGDSTKILAACDRLHPKEVADYTRRLLAVIDDRQSDVHSRVSAGEALGYLGDPRIGDEQMVEVPGGTFIMGSDEAGAEKPRQEVDIPAFSIERYPVTNAQFKKFIDDNGYGRRELWSEEGWRWLAASGRKQPVGWDDPRFNRPNFPVVGVSWYEADAYARWAGKRLPAEAQWEKAARGGDARAWPWGNDWDPANANTGEGGVGGTTPVGIYPAGASPYGALDMAGNVWEWTADWYSEKGYSAPYKPASRGQAKVLRGGSWHVTAGSARCASRHHAPPDYWSARRLGFRCVGAPRRSP